MAAKKNKELRSSAYSFKEGSGGASGSFPVGAMPGKQCSQPEGSILFPGFGEGCIRVGGGVMS